MLLVLKVVVNTMLLELWFLFGKTPHQTYSMSNKELLPQGLCSERGRA